MMHNVMYTYSNQMNSYRLWPFGQDIHSHIHHRISMVAASELRAVMLSRNDNI